MHNGRDLEQPKGHRWAYFKVPSAPTFLKATWSARKGKAIVLVSCMSNKGAPNYVV